jgi:hypothetical protein
VVTVEWPAWERRIRNRAESVDDYFERLTWLYGEPYERIRANAPDVAKWRALGHPK